jgi:Papain family cysteine protease
MCSLRCIGALVSCDAICIGLCMRHRRSEWAAAAPPTSEHKPTVAQHMLPNGVDWRGTAADSPVKNQAACGSCWVITALHQLRRADATFTHRLCKGSSLMFMSMTRTCAFYRHLAPLGQLRRHTTASLASKSCSRSKTSSTAPGTYMM